MKRIEIGTAGGESTVLVGAGILQQLAAVLEEYGEKPPASVVTNTTVGPLYGRSAARSAVAAPPIELPDGEVYKRWPQVEAVCRSWLEHGVHRGDTVMAVGGGVVTDTVGFAAAVYQRGIPWIAVPTTLLAMVDAAIGGKTGVNLEAGKNLVGAFWHPTLVVSDVSTLSTLPEREIRAGLAEVVKAAWIGDRKLLDVVDGHEGSWQGALPETWSKIVFRSASVKAEIVIADEREAGRRKALNLGHTIGHALEAVTGYRRFLHGEAVAWGLRAVSTIAHARGVLGSDAQHRLCRAVDRLEPLPPMDDLDPLRVLEHLGHDKKRDDLGVAWVLPTDDGVLLDQRVGADEVVEVIRHLSAGPHSST